EVKDFLRKDLGEDGLRKSVIVAATSDESHLMQLRAAKLATSIAEHFRDQGKTVLLMMDSVTRFADARRSVDI
ncbi:flagellum-specific ATP synthase FliI, partial [Escherichia coli]|nr:flagellum-specific ATP synthase FliI [Escherichia coli]